jgi:UDP-N-acetyl-D-mannosaminuronic acid dehydrogenase
VGGFQELFDRIEAAKAQLVVIGLGYVGLPVAGRFARAGFRVTGLDVAEHKVGKVNAGGCPIEGKEPGLAELIGEVVGNGGFRATSDYGACRDADVILIAVETPIDGANQPRYTALRSALHALEMNMPVGRSSRSTRDVPQLVIVESTVAPGTMDRLVCPTLEARGRRRAGEDFYLVHCPERVMPGRLLSNLTHMSRVVGGHTPQAAELAKVFYRHVVEADLDLADCVTAELVKTAENAYRDVQIAFANELALICQHVGADVWQVRELVNKSPGRNVLLPGAGVGGHCIPKDPWLLAYGASDMAQARLIPAAREINDYMPLNVADLVVNALDEAGVRIERARIAVLGYAYLENSDDTRNTPSLALVNRLEELGARVRIHDPYVSQYKGDLAERVHGCDAVVVMVKHDVYKNIELGQLREWLGGSAAQRLGPQPVLVDGRRVFEPGEAQAAGFVFRGVGIGH